MKFLTNSPSPVSLDLRGRGLVSHTRVRRLGRIVGPDLDPRWQRRIRSRQQFVRLGNAPHTSCDHPGWACLPPLSRKVRIAQREAVVDDKRLVRLLKQLNGLRGRTCSNLSTRQGQIHPVDSIAVNEYLDERSGHHFTAKAFRTWKRLGVAAGMLYREKPVEKAGRSENGLKKVFAAVAEALGNTPTVCRKYYVHPGLIDAYLDGSSLRSSNASARHAASRSRRRAIARPISPPGLAGKLGRFPARLSFLPRPSSWHCDC